MSRDEIEVRAAERMDGILNLLTGAGDPKRDKSMHTQLAHVPEITLPELDEMWRRWLPRAIVNIPADEKAKKGFALEDVEGIEGDDIKPLMSAAEDLGVLLNCADLERWGMYYGGSGLLVAVDDGLEPHEPLDLTRVTKLHGFHVLDRHCFTEVWMPSGTHGREIEAYRLNGDAGVMVGEVVHKSRVLRFNGSEAPPHERSMRDWWGIPLLQVAIQEFKQLLAANHGVAQVMADLEVDVFQLVGLGSAIQTNGAAALAAMQLRLREMAMGKSIARSIALDAGDKDRPAESYTPTSRSLQGLADAVSLWYRACAIAAQIPASRLLQETPGGLNTGGNSGDLEAFYGRCAAELKQRWSKWVNWQLEVIMAAKDGPTAGFVPETWTVSWLPLWEPTEKEKAETRKLRAEADEIYHSIGSASDRMVYRTRSVLGSTGEIEPLETGDRLPGAQGTSPDGEPSDAGVDDDAGDGGELPDEGGAT